MNEEAAAQAAQIATEMARLKSRREGLKIAAANMKTRANTLMTADEVDLAALSAAEMQIKDKFEKILLLDEQILDLMITDDEIADEISSADTHNYEIQVVLQSIGLIKNKKSSGKMAPLYWTFQDHQSSRFRSILRSFRSRRKSAFHACRYGAETVPGPTSGVALSAGGVCTPVIASGRNSRKFK